MLLYLFLLPIVSCLESKMGHYAMSVAGLRKLLDLETSFIDELEGYTEALTLKIDTIESFLDQVRSKKAEWKSNPEEFVAHPLNSYSLIRRLHEDWSYFELYMSQAAGEDQVENIKRLAEEEAPKRKDLDDAIMAIIGLQIYYKLDAANLSKGLINGTQYNSQLTVQDTLSIAQFCHEVQQYKYAIDWYEASIKLVGSIKHDELCKIVYNLKESDVYGYYLQLLQKNSERYSLDALNLLNKVADSNVHLWLQRRAVEESAFYFNLKSQTVDSPQTPVKIGCSGQYPASTSLTCHFLRNFSHFLTLAPLKVETLSLDPYVVLFHDVIYDSEIQELKAIDLSTLRHDHYEFPMNAMKSVYLKKEVNHVLNNRVKDMTGMRIGENKDFLLINYGVGGYIKLHSDVYKAEHVNRSTSIIFFLSNVTQGGATVFPDLELSVKPIKGAALLFHIDERTVHTSCPVLMGSKWTLVKWLSSV